MNTEYQKLGNTEPQREGTMDFILKSAVAVLVIILSITVFVSADGENMVLSLAWPILLLPLLSACKELCVLLARLVGMPNSRSPGDH